MDVVLVVDTFDCIVELSESVYLGIAVVAFDCVEDFLPVCVSVWVVGFALALRVFVFTDSNANCSIPQKYVGFPEI